MFYKKQSLSQSAAVVNSFLVTAQLHSGSLSSSPKLRFDGFHSWQKCTEIPASESFPRNLWVTSNPSPFCLSDHKKSLQFTPPASVVPNYYLVIFHVLSPTPEFSHCWNWCQSLCTCEQNIFRTVRGHAALFGLVSGFWCQTKTQIIRGNTQTHICTQSPTTVTQHAIKNGQALWATQWLCYVITFFFTIQFKITIQHFIFVLFLQPRGFPYSVTPIRCMK